MGQATGLAELPFAGVDPRQPASGEGASAATVAVIYASAVGSHLLSFAVLVKAFIEERPHQQISEGMLLAGLLAPIPVVAGADNLMRGTSFGRALGRSAIGWLKGVGAWVVSPLLGALVQARTVLRD